MVKQFSICLALFACRAMIAQMPDTDLWLFELVKDKAGKTVPSKPLNVTNRPGYDNQPSFSADDKKIYYVSVGEDKQADVHVYDIHARKAVKLTNSRESEYSPTPLPGSKYIGSVVVEADSAQRIHLINTETGNHEKVFPEDSVGYYTFLNKDTLMYYKLTEPHSLWYFVPKTGENARLGNSPTRGFRAVNRYTVLYGTKDTASVTFYTYNFLLRKAELYCTYPSTGEDIVWHPALGLIKSEGVKLYRFNAFKKEWELLYDLEGFGLKKITRFTFDSKNNYLVVVNNL